MAHHEGQAPAANGAAINAQLSIGARIANMDAHIMARVELVEQNLRVQLARETHETHAFVVAHVKQEMDRYTEEMLAATNSLNDRMREVFEMFRKAFLDIQKFVGLPVEHADSSTPVASLCAKLEQTNSHLIALADGERAAADLVARADREHHRAVVQPAEQVAVGLERPDRRNLGCVLAAAEQVHRAGRRHRDVQGQARRRGRGLVRPRRGGRPHRSRRDQQLGRLSADLVRPGRRRRPRQVQGLRRLARARQAHPG